MYSKMNLFRSYGTSIAQSKSITLRYVRCFTVLLFTFIFSVASSKAQTVKFDGKQLSMDEIIQEIRKQTGFDFIYKKQAIESFPTLSPLAIDKPLNSFLNELFKNLPVSFEIKNKTIVLKELEQPEGVRQVYGCIRNSDGQPLQGVSIKSKSKASGTSTDQEGRYLLKCGKGETITFSMVGYLSQEVKVQGSKMVDITLSTTDNMMEDVVVIGYGTRSREKVTGAISSISAKEIENLPATSFQSMLQGRVPGLNVLNFTGEPGASSIALIRGLSGSSRDGLPANTSPLYVIDGMPYSMEDMGAIPSLKGAKVTTSNIDPLSMINPDDIESIDILRDASATAIYGSRGANGVIIVKTKMGKIGKPTITFNTNLGLSSPPAFRSTLGGKLERDTRMRYINKYAELDADFHTINNAAFLTDSINPFYNNATDWQKLYYRYSRIQNYTLGISGAIADQLSYRTNLGYSDEGGIMKATGYNRYTLSTNMIFKPSKSFDINLDIAGTFSEKKRGNGADQNAMGAGGNFNTSLYPTPVSDELSNFFKAFDLLDEVNQNGSVRSSLGLTYKLGDSFRFTNNLRMSYGLDERNTFKPSALNTNNKPSLNNYFGKNTTLLNEHVLTYFTSLDHHNFIVDLGFSNDRLIRSYTRTNALDGISDYMKAINGFPKERVTTIEEYSKSVRLSYFARLNYDFASKYIVSGSIRRDGSSRFGDNNRWGYFPAGAVAWNIHKEEFMKEVDWVNNMKLRLSSGVSGTEFSFDYLTQGLYDIGTAGEMYNTTTAPTYNNVISANPWYQKGLTNPDLTWEKSIDKNVGFDGMFLSNRLGVNFDFYWKESRGKLFDLALPNTSGYKMIYSNGQDVLNYGYELAIYLDLIRKSPKWKWSINMNGAINRNVLLGIGEEGKDVYLRSMERLLRVGRPLNDFYVHQTLGVYATDEDVPVNPKTGYRLTGSNTQYPFKAGDIMVADLDGDYRVGYEVSNANGDLISGDKIFGGNPNPTITGGFRSDLRYGQFSLSTFFVYSVGRQIINKTLADRLNPNTLLAPNSLPDVSEFDFWEQSGDQAMYPAYNPFNKNNYINYSYQQTLFVEEGSFLRLKNVQLSYELPSALIKRFKLKRLNIFGQMDNVFIIQKFNGPDAENVDFSGIDRGGFYPIPKKITFGLNVQL